MWRRAALRRSRHACGLLLSLLLGACAAGRPQPPYPAFIQADELPDVFLAALPGVRAKQFAGDSRTRRSSNRILLPANWSGTTGASPDKSLELYLLRGRIRIGDRELDRGGYAWFPPGFRGANLATDGGAEILYFLDDANPASAIRSPLVVDGEAADWRPPSPAEAAGGVAVKELRRDPGSGARSWLLRVTPAAAVGWQRRAQSLEGYLVSGHYRGVECVAGRAVPGEYTEGGYFLRPPGAVYGGPDEKALQASVWFLRQRGPGEATAVDACAPAE